MTATMEEMLAAAKNDLEEAKLEGDEHHIETAEVLLKMLKEGLATIDPATRMWSLKPRLN